MYEELNKICCDYIDEKIDKKEFINRLQNFCIINDINDIRLYPEFANNYSLKVVVGKYPKIEINDYNNIQYIFDFYGGFDLGSNDLYMKVESIYLDTKIEKVRKLNNGIFLYDSLTLNKNNEKIKFSSEVKNSKFEISDLHTIKYFDSDKDKIKPVLEKSFKYSYNDLNSCYKIASPHLFSRVFYQRRGKSVYYFQNFDDINLQGIFVNVNGDRKYLDECLSSSVVQMIEKDYNITESLSSIILSGVVDGIKHTLEVKLGFDGDKIKYSVDDDICFDYDGSEYIDDIFGILEDKFGGPFIDGCYRELILLKNVLKDEDLFFCDDFSPSSYASNKERFMTQVLAAGDNIFNLIRNEADSYKSYDKMFVKNDDKSA